MQNQYCWISLFWIPTVFLQFLYCLGHISISQCSSTCRTEDFSSTSNDCVSDVCVSFESYGFTHLANRYSNPVILRIVFLQDICYLSGNVDYVANRDVIVGDR